MRITYFGDTLTVDRFNDGFHCVYDDGGDVSYHDIYITDPNLILSEIDDFEMYEECGDDYLPEPPHYDTFSEFSWNVLEAVKYLFARERDNGWSNLIPDYAKYDREV